MKKALKFKIGKMEYLFPREQGLTYQEMEDLVSLTNRENPPKRGVWEVGSPDINEASLLAELHDLGLLPLGFYDYPIVSGSFFESWKKKTGLKTYVGWLKPFNDQMWTWVTSVLPEDRQGVYFTNWRS